jgi:hypothetical protein
VVTDGSNLYPAVLGDLWSGVYSKVIGPFS